MFFANLGVTRIIATFLGFLARTGIRRLVVAGDLALNFIATAAAVEAAAVTLGSGAATAIAGASRAGVACNTATGAVTGAAAAQRNATIIIRR